MDSHDNREKRKIINITSGTPSMTACWVLLHKSGLIPNSTLVQSFEIQYARARGRSTQEVNPDIEHFPEIKAPEDLRLELEIAYRENRDLRQRVDASELDAQVPELIGQSESLREIKEKILHDIDNETHILILGEPGTGKEEVARAVWRLHHRDTDDELTTYNCSGFSDDLIVSGLFGHKKGAFTGADADKTGILKKCDGKMVFLDEIGNLPIRSQQVLLRVLQFGEIQPVGSDHVDRVDVPIIAATNKDIDDPQVFAQDLKGRFYDSIVMPPLRDRREDIPLLANHFLNIFSKQKNLAPLMLGDDVIQKLKEYDWPGNVRDLQNWIRLVTKRIDGGEITLDKLPRRLIEDIMREDNDIELPDLPLPLSLHEYVELIRNKARMIADGNMAEVDRLLKQKGAEKARKSRRKQKRKK